MSEDPRSRTSSSVRSDDDELPEVFLVSDAPSEVISGAVRAPRKRPHKPAEDSASESDSSEGTVPVAKISAARRGRGRPSTPGANVGLRAAEKVLAEAVQAAERAEKEAKRSAEQAKRATNLERAARDIPAKDPEQCTSAELQVMLNDALEEIRGVSKVSKGLKGTCQKALKGATARIAEITEIYVNRTATEEVRKLRAENVRLAAQLKELAVSQEALKADLLSMRTKETREAQSADQPQDPVLQQVLAQLANLNSRFSFLESRVLRPPLGAGGPAPAPKSPPSSYAAKAAAPKVATAAPPTTSSAAPPEAKGKARRGKKSGRSAPVSTPLATTSAPIQTSRAVERWETVGTKEKAAKARRRAAKKRARRARQLRAPRSTAVVLTLQPSAIERGVVYADILRKARAAIDLQALDLASGLRVKPTRTGARLLEVPGATSGDKADAIAEKLRSSFDVADVVVARPTKRADLRISGLDDSVTSEEVVAAVARAAEIRADDVKCGTIRSGVRGLGAVLVSCPVTAARKLADGRRLLVGWVSAQVQLLEPRPARCFRCLATGHVGIQCSAPVDCSDRCYRCSQPGHKAGTCELPLHCLFCAAAGKPADHRVGGKACAGVQSKKGVGRAVQQPSPKRGGTGGAVQQPAPKSVVGGAVQQPAPSSSGETVMDTN